jgi:glyoxylate utilization-related uncharacterized protein
MPSLTFIDTNKIPRSKAGGAGEFAEIMNNALCGAKNVVGTLRWLGKGDQLDARNDSKTHQLIYLMQGEGTITLDSKEYPVARGAGVYIGPMEGVIVKHAGSAPLKLFHLVVPKQG